MSVYVVKYEALVLHMRVLINKAHPLDVEGGGTALDTVDLIAFSQQEFREVGAVLAGDAGDECFGRQNQSPLYLGNNVQTRRPSRRRPSCLTNANGNQGAMIIRFTVSANSLL